MGKVVADITTSLDGFIAGPNDGPEVPLGEGGEQLHQWVYDLASWREPHGLAGGKTNRDSEVLDEAFKAAGAIVLGRRMFDNAGGWGENPPFHGPVFVLAHHPREPLELQGGTTFTFVTDGIESALEQARAVAAGQDVFVGGGADVINQYLAAGLVDDLELHIVPLVLGAGARLFEGVGPALTLERVRAVEAPGVTHVKYRVLT